MNYSSCTEKMNERTGKICANNTEVTCPPRYIDEDKEFYRDLLMEQQEQM